MPGLVLLSADEAGEVLTVQRASFALDCAVNYPGYTAPIEQTLGELRDEMASAGTVVVGIREDALGSPSQTGRLIAVVRLRESGPDSVYLARLSVVPDREGQGLGTRLMQAVHDLVPQRFPMASTIGLSVEGDNARLVSWYLRLGYRIAQRGTQNSPHEWTMIRPVGPFLASPGEVDDRRTLHQRTFEECDIG